MRGSPIRAIRKTSNDRIASVSVTKKEKEKLSVHPGAQQPQGEERKTSMPGAQQLQAHGNDEIVTLPPPLSSDVLIEQHRGKLLSEKVLHKLFHEFGHGRMTSDQGRYTGSTDILRGDGRQ